MWIEPVCPRFGDPFAPLRGLAGGGHAELGDGPSPKSKLSGRGGGVKRYIGIGLGPGPSLVAGPCAYA
jgi:hypothetical protein